MNPRGHEEALEEAEEAVDVEGSGANPGCVEAAGIGPREGGSEEKDVGVEVTWLGATESSEVKSVGGRKVASEEAAGHNSRSAGPKVSSHVLGEQ